MIGVGWIGGSKIVDRFLDSSAGNVEDLTIAGDLEGNLSLQLVGCGQERCGHLLTARKCAVLAWQG